MRILCICPLVLIYKYLIEGLFFELSIYNMEDKMEQTIYLIYALFAFITGTLFGSFFTLAIYRIPRKQDITHTRSYCPNCKHKLGFFDCFPILSYVSTIGRCKYCKRPISMRYPLIELVNGFVFLFIFIFLGFTWEALILTACYVYLFLVIGSDIMEKKMTDEEIAEVNAIVEEKKKKKAEKKSKKAGALSVEILIAAIIFVFYFITAIYTKSNYSSNLGLYKRKVDATNVCLNLINEEKAKEFENIASRTGSQTIDSITYSYSVDVSNTLKDDTTEYTNAKSINVSVNYVVKGDTYTVTLDALKVVQ